MRFLRRKSLVNLVVLAVVSGSLVILISTPALAACSFNKDNDHTLGSVFHGWDRFFCQPANNYDYNAFTNHGHGNKYVALWHDGTTHLHCDTWDSGSVNAFCSDIVPNVNHYTHHDIAGVSCLDRFGDGHGMNCHEMESLA